MLRLAEIHAAGFAGTRKSGLSRFAEKWLLSEIYWTSYKPSGNGIALAGAKREFANTRPVELA